MKKIMALLLLFCLLVPMLVSCPSGDTPGGGGGSGGEEDGEGVPWLDSVGDKDFGGETVVFSCMPGAAYEIY